MQISTNVNKAFSISNVQSREQISVGGDAAVDNDAAASAGAAAVVAGQGYYAKQPKQTELNDTRRTANKLSFRKYLYFNCIYFRRSRASQNGKNQR